MKWALLLGPYKNSKMIIIIVKKKENQNYIWNNHKRRRCLYLKTKETWKKPLNDFPALRFVQDVEKEVNLQRRYVAVSSTRSSNKQKPSSSTSISTFLNHRLILKMTLSSYLIIVGCMPQVSQWNLVDCSLQIVNSVLNWRYFEID